jgi:hypothetical protein
VDPLAVAAANYGTVPDWLAGVGTVGTQAFTLWLFAREQSDRRRAQAPDGLRLAHDAAAQAGRGRPHLRLKVKNDSTEPVYDVRATMVPYDSPHAADPEAAAGQAGTMTAKLWILPGEEVLEQASTRPGQGAGRERSGSPSPTPRGSASAGRPRSRSASWPSWP